MIAAVAFHLLNTGTEGFPRGVPAQHSYNFELAAMYVATLRYFTAAGAGPFSVDEQVLGGELKFEPALLSTAVLGSASVKQPRAVTMMKTAVLAATAIAKPSVEAMCRRPLAPPGRGAARGDPPPVPGVAVHREVVAHHRHARPRRERLRRGLLPRGQPRGAGRGAVRHRRRGARVVLLHARTLRLGRARGGRRPRRRQRRRRRRRHRRRPATTS